MDLQKLQGTQYVKINLSLDGTRLSKRYVHVTLGFKISNIAAHDVYTLRPLFASQDPLLLQSRNLCIPVKIIMKKEIKEVYGEFKQIFQHFHHLVSTKSETGLPPDSPFTEAGFKPLKLAIHCDMSACWKLFGVSGATKVHTSCPCDCCAVRLDYLSKANLVLRGKWSQ
jgi:hypothetical protein